MPKKKIATQFAISTQFALFLLVISCHAFPHYIITSIFFELLPYQIIFRLLLPIQFLSCVYLPPELIFFC